MRLQIIAPFAAELQDIKADDTVDFVCFDEAAAQPEIVSAQIETIQRQTGRLILQGYQISEELRKSRVLASLQTDHEFSPSGVLLVTHEPTED